MQLAFRVDIIRCRSLRDIKNGLFASLEFYGDVFPVSRDANILLKPNLNSNMNALTGNTTDLRLLAVVIEFLKDRGYTRITIGEGTNSGFYRNRISVISRLAIDRLAGFYGVAVKDLNYSDPVPVDFERAVKACVAKECVETEMLINMPKLKTHFEMGMSVCLKNLMGCLVGQENKKKTHQALAANILNINKKIIPHLHIVDAIISMEGLGPTRGTPINTDMIIVGTDPYVIDLMCARIAGFDYRTIRPLLEAEKLGLIDSRHHGFVNGYKLDAVFQFKPAKPGPIAAFIHSPKRQRYFLAIRNTSLFRYLCSTRIVGKLLVLTGLRQDVFINEEMEIDSLSVNSEKCKQCGRCSTFCPISLNPPDELSKPEASKACIQCLYCFCICPERAIEFHGKPGFFKEQLRQYDVIIRDMALKNGCHVAPSGQVAT